MYGPFSWQRCEDDHGGFKKLTWYGIVKEFNCEVTSTRSSCVRERRMAFTHRKFGNEGEGRTAQLDYFAGPRGTSDKACVHTDVKKRGTLGTIARSVRLNRDMRL